MDGEGLRTLSPNLYFVQPTPGEKCIRQEKASSVDMDDHRYLSVTKRDGLVACGRTPMQLDAFPQRYVRALALCWTASPQRSCIEAQ